MSKTLSFEQALSQCEQRSSKPSVLLGNGFSRAFSENFSYGRLRDRAAMDDLSIEVNALFDDQARSDDFETVIDHLRQSANLVELYDPSQKKLISTMREDAEVVQRGLIEALTAIHPDSARQIESGSYIAARKFLKNFTEIFTLNYDLLLYWTVLQRLLRYQPVRNDGFSRSGGGPLTWKRPKNFTEQYLMYLHGAVHLYAESDSVRKIGACDGRLLDQLRSNLELGTYPMVVTEGSREDKEARIARNPYLTYCHDRLRAVEGDLFIYGVALSPNDDHIMDAITARESMIENLYVSLFQPGCAESDEVAFRANLLARKRRRNGGDKLRVRFYDAESAKVWEPT